MIIIQNTVNWEHFVGLDTQQQKLRLLMCSSTLKSEDVLYWEGPSHARLLVRPYTHHRVIPWLAYTGLSAQVVQGPGL